MADIAFDTPFFADILTRPVRNSSLLGFRIRAL